MIPLDVHLGLQPDDCGVTGHDYGSGDDLDIWTSP